MSIGRAGSAVRPFVPVKAESEWMTRRSKRFDQAARLPRPAGAVLERRQHVAVCQAFETVGIGPGRNEPDDFDLVAAHLGDDVGEDVGRGHDTKGFIRVALDGG